MHGNVAGHLLENGAGRFPRLGVLYFDSAWLAYLAPPQGIYIKPALKWTAIVCDYASIQKFTNPQSSRRTNIGSWKLMLQPRQIWCGYVVKRLRRRNKQTTEQTNIHINITLYILDLVTKASNNYAISHQPSILGYSGDVIGAEGPNLGILGSTRQQFGQL